MSTSNAVSNVLGSFGGQLGLVNTGNVEVTGAQWSSLAGNGLNVVMGVAKSTPWGAAGTAAATVAEFGFNLATASQQPSTSGFNYSNEGRTPQTPSYDFGPNWRGKGFSDPRLLDASEGYRGLNTYSGVYASLAEEHAALDLSDGSTIAGLFKVQRTDGKWVDGANVAFAHQKTGVQESVDAQGNKVFRFEDGDVYTHVVMSGTQTDVALPDNSGTHWIGVKGNSANDVPYRRCA